MKRIITSNTHQAMYESFLDSTAKTEYAYDIAKNHYGKYRQEGLGWLAQQYGFNLVELLDVLEQAVKLDLAKCNKFASDYQIYQWEG